MYDYEVFFNVIQFISLVILIFGVFKFFIKIFNNKFKKNNHEKWLEIKSKWNKIQIKTSDCDVMQQNDFIHSREINENDSLLDLLDKKSKLSVTTSEVKYSKVICYLKSEDGKVIEKFERIVPGDNTIIEFKLKMRDYVDIYISKEIYSISDDNDKVLSEYVIDLDFLNEDIKSL